MELNATSSLFDVWSIDKEESGCKKSLSLMLAIETGDSKSPSSPNVPA
jgi:hypothetical protein